MSRWCSGIGGRPVRYFTGIRRGCLYCGAGHWSQGDGCRAYRRFSNMTEMADEFF